MLFQAFPAVSGKASQKAGEWFVAFLRALGLRDETPNARLVGMHAFRSTFLKRAEVLGVVNAECITGHASNVTNVDAVQNGQVAQEASAVVRRYRGEPPLDMKKGILERIDYGDLTFFSVPPLAQRESTQLTAYAGTR